MASYLVYIPGVTGASTDHLSRVGLGGLLDPSSSPDCVDATRFTPDGGQGVIFYWLDADPRNNPRYTESRPDIHWSPAKPSGTLAENRFYLGVCDGQQVTPDAILRKVNLGGLKVTLEDGNDWMIPVARQLPRKYELDARTGAPALKVKSQYQEFYDQAEKNYRMLMQRAEGETLTISGGWSFAETALAYNYRINADVMDWLGLIGEVSLMWLIGATFELTKIEEIETQKKTAEFTHA